LLDSEQISRLMKDLCERAEVVILDTPPILAVSDTALLVPHADGVIAVVVPGQTLRPMLRQLKEQVAIAQGHLIGAVLNKVTPPHGGYYYRYYRYYSRYYGESE
jgi:Mrp family chromosome partitioning ATPase